MDKLLTIIIIISAVFFLYNKIRMWRSSESLLKRIYQTKSSLALGFFLTAFGANLLIFNRSMIDIVVGVLFAILGVANIIYGYRASRHYVAQLGD
ncbi:YtpI family protein [Alkalihalobacillus sp. MEB130]|uniref:YtpI family protein n=1 Tax=Alkalihalobacillus sp. MEB130 TaxID=2976704 RepID=UPI0028DD751A|nr:YtpI family protein [Alkalihalobacillus sp. MEB130]MDT8859405.1 YtpI family protein [Alkalihalobacillus sp. MEB130]